MTNPTETVPPLQRVTTIAEHLVSGIAWATQIGAATTDLVITFQPAVWRSVKDPATIVLLWISALAMTALWGAALWEESRSYYNRWSQRLSRKAGLVGHLGVLLIAVASAAEQPHRAGLWLALGVMTFAAFVSWAVWMESRFLPDEDQAVIDAILSREAAQRAATFDATQKEQRHERLAAIVGSLGYTLTDRPAPASKVAPEPAIKWPVPSGKHKPLVYFIRNGNRLKIGTTTALKHRIRTLALRAENIALLVDGGQNVEHAFHKQFAEHRIGNTEWFAYEGPLADYVRGEAGRISREGQGQ